MHMRATAMQTAVTFRGASEARQCRKLAAAMRTAEHPDAVSIDSGTDVELLEALLKLPGFRPALAERIVALRPFSSKMDMVTRVNEDISVGQARLGPKWLPYLHVAGDTDEKEAYLPQRRGPKRKASVVPAASATDRDDGGRTGSSSSSSPRGSPVALTAHVAPSEPIAASAMVVSSASTAASAPLSVDACAPMESTMSIEDLVNLFDFDGELDAAVASFGEGGSAPPSVCLSIPPSAPAMTATSDTGSRANGHMTALEDEEECDGGDSAGGALHTAEGRLEECSTVAHGACSCLAYASVHAITLLAFAAHLLGVPSFADALLCLLKVLRKRLSRFSISTASTQYFGNDLSSTLHSAMLEHTFVTTRPSVIVFLTLVLVHLVMLSLAMLFDWPKNYPMSTGGRPCTDFQSCIVHAEMHSLTLIAFAMLMMVQSRYCTPRRYQWVMGVSAFLLITLCQHAHPSSPRNAHSCARALPVRVSKRQPKSARESTPERMRACELRVPTDL